VARVALFLAAVPAFSLEARKHAIGEAIKRFLQALPASGDLRRGYRSFISLAAS
jgi:hypothetical protein